MRQSAYCSNAALTIFIQKQEANRPKRSLEYQRLSTDFLSEGLIFSYQQLHYRINKSKQCLRKAGP